MPYVTIRGCYYIPQVTIYRPPLGPGSASTLASLTLDSVGTRDYTTLHSTTLIEIHSERWY
jgi:hypothetical protein